MTDLLQINELKMESHETEFQNALTEFTDDSVTFYGNTDIAGFNQMKDTLTYTKTTRQNVFDKTNLDVEKIAKVVEVYNKYDASAIGDDV